MRSIDGSRLSFRNLPTATRPPSLQHQCVPFLATRGSFYCSGDLTTSLLGDMRVILLMITTYHFG